MKKPPRSRGAIGALCLVFSAAALAVGCNVAIGGGVLVAGVVAGVLTYDCTEGVGVTLWDHTSAHPLCDAVVVAKQGGKSVTFSPCYNAFLDEGAWTVTATKPGYLPAVGSVTVSHEHRCTEPAYHSLELTLLREGEGARAEEITPPAKRDDRAVGPPPNTVPSAPTASPPTAPSAAEPNVPPATTTPPATPPTAPSPRPDVPKAPTPTPGPSALPEAPPS